MPCRSKTTRRHKEACIFYCRLLFYDDAAADLDSVLLGKLGLPGWGFIATRYYRVLCKILGIGIRIDGQPIRDHAVLFVSNHVSWADILIIGSIMPIAFVSKAEVGNWPLVGVTARLQRTVFVDRRAVSRPATPSPRWSIGWRPACRSCCLRSTSSDGTACCRSARR